MTRTGIILRGHVAALACTLLGLSWSAESRADGFLFHHGHTVVSQSVGIAAAPTQVQFVQMATPVVSSPATFHLQVAPAQLQVAAPTQLQVGSTLQLQSAPAPQLQMISVPQLQASQAVDLQRSGVTTISFTVPQVQATTGTAVQGTFLQQSSLGELQIAQQHVLLQQLHASGWFKALKDQLLKRLAEVYGNNLPARNLVAKFLLDEAVKFLQNTPFGPFIPLLQPILNDLIDTIIKEQPTPPTPPPPAVTPDQNGTVIPGNLLPVDGGKRSFLITIQEVSGPGGNDTPNGPTPPKPPVDPQTPTGITPDSQSPSEHAASVP
ncbi:hypothetical protein [Aquisphaera insulae]|uniref:hypothetical protein n=1 Tax=Aquisphaera insulae TaxID=2712864 RepID=UPI0013EC70DD|nr:hypothetical protein [Aquisphaera insulae]